MRNRIYIGLAATGGVGCVALGLAAHVQSLGMIFKH